MSTLVNHLSYAIRRFRKHPGPALAVVGTMAIAIGANTAIFSFVNALLLRPFPFHDAEQLVEIHSRRGGEQGKISMREVADIRESVTTLEDIAAHKGGAGGYNYSESGRPEEWRAILTTGNLFEVLGVPMAAGAAWPESLDRDRGYSVILSEHVWRRRFNGRDDVAGETITLDHAPGYTVHGVAGPGIDFPSGIDVYRSIGGYVTLDKRDSRDVTGIARIERPATLAQFQSELDALAERLAGEYPLTNSGLTFEAVSFRETYSGNVRPYLLLLTGAVGFVLLIACANVAHLLLAQLLNRKRELAVRAALGAGRKRLATGILVESLLLAGTAAIAGVALAYPWMHALRTLIGKELPAWLVIELDGRVLAFSAVIAVLAAFLSTLAPAVELLGAGWMRALNSVTRGASADRSSGRARDWMIVAEAALAVVLLAGAGLLIRGFAQLQSQETGFRSDRVATFRVALGWKRYIDGPSVRRYYEQAVAAIEAIPGVHEVALDSAPPLSRQEITAPATVQREGQSAQDAMLNPYVTRHVVSENYFALTQIALREGRTFSEFDQPDTDAVTVVSERLAKLLWPGESPLGKRLTYEPNGRRPEQLQVVGVAGDVQSGRLGGEAGFDLYVPYRQASYAANQYVLARTSLGPAEFQRHTEQAMWGIDPDQSVFDFQTWDQRILDGVWQIRTARLLLMLLAAVALILTAVGIYGVMSFLAGLRRREMGIRLALGATPHAVRRIVIGHGARQAAAGIALGTLAALALASVTARWLEGVSAKDAWSFAAPILVVGFATLAASAIPAWRVSRTDPNAILRDD